MIYKRCTRCGKRIEEGKQCACYIKPSKAYKRVYSKPTGIKTEYHKQRWRDIRNAILSSYDNIDVYSLFRYHTIIQADVVHHIESTTDRPDQFYSEDNLIPVSRRSHEEIHYRYKHEDAEKVKEELREMCERFKTGGGWKVSEYSDRPLQPDFFPQESK